MQRVEFHLLYQHLWERGNKINNKAEKEKKFFLKIVKSNTKLSKKKSGAEEITAMHEVERGPMFQGQQEKIS